MAESMAAGVPVIAMDLGSCREVIADGKAGFLVNSVDEAVQIFGGYGHVKELPVERYFRDAKITEIYEGTSEIMKIIIGNSILNEFT